MDGRGLVGRRRAQSIMLLALGLDALAVVVFLAAPSGTGPMFSEPPSVAGLPLGTLIGGVGIALNVLGLAWMVRIIRADPESHSSSSRAVRGR